MPGTSQRLELWGGVECTVNRVGDEHFDQLELNGHARRPDDLRLFADLGIAALRYPVLWERTERDGESKRDWRFADERLPLIRELGMRPIVGLVHHGSGPLGTSLLEDSFATGLARFAHAVAERFPWVEEWTPVNEPLTTARFSALYGHWYPHMRDECAFARAVVVQCRAVVLAMHAIHQVVPHARLVQTEDIGTTHSTPRLAYQAEFENERRWLSLDLLSGRIDERHRFWRWFRDRGVEETDLRFFLDHPCPPDVVGVNHYLTSDRFLDDHCDRYRPELHGGNDRDAYVDLSAWRVLARPPEGVAGALRAAWERFRLPVAITESHNGCTREEQLRWLAEGWRAADELGSNGIDVRAVTVWSLLGTFGWNRLVTERGGLYEPGAFDVRGRVPRPTALAAMARSLAAAGEWRSPLLADRGWWRRDRDRLEHPPYGDAPHARRRRPGPPLVITGASGTLGRELVRQCELRAIDHRALSRVDLDITDPEAVSAVLDELRPWGVANASGYVRVDDAETDDAACFSVNVDGSRVLAEACAARGIRLAGFSSDLVFDGGVGRPYVEDDPVAPLSVYGRSKALAESATQAAHPEALVIRTSAFFGPSDDANFVTRALARLAAGADVVAADDAAVSPTYVPDLVSACLDLLVDGGGGLWHLANDGAETWAELARAAAVRAGLPPRVIGVSTHELGLAAPRPLFSALGSRRGLLLPPLDDALGRYVAARAA
ncbi:MAG: family 1 glycosylhydrolase [Gaiellaceae bacterium]